jgi:DNA-binding transcriptional LysR family regulator
MSEHPPSWDLYGALLAVLREGSLSGAARALGVAQPTVRRQIEQLEAELGVVLFTRASNGLVPTETALAALPYAESIASTAHALARAVAGGADGQRGTVRVTCSEVMGAEVLPPLLLTLRRARPALQIELAATNRTEDLLRRDADVAVRMVEPTQAGLVRRRVGRVELGLFAHADYLAEHPPPRSLDALAEGHSLVGADRGRGILDALAAMGANLGARHFGLRCDSDLVQLAAVRAGLGIGVCQVPLAARHGQLRRVLPKVAPQLEVWVAMHEDLRANPRVRAVYEHLAEGLEAYAAPARRAR